MRNLCNTYVPRTRSTCMYTVSRQLFTVRVDRQQKTKQKKSLVVIFLIYFHDWTIDVHKKNSLLSCGRDNRGENRSPGLLNCMHASSLSSST